jgi:flavocytochrome c
MTEFNRRQFLKGVGVTAGALTVGPLPIIKASLLPESARKETHNVVVLGSGLAGLSAALEAKLGGADVIILEKEPNGKDGGNSKLALGGIVVPPDRTKAGADIYFEDFQKKSGGKGNAELSRVLAENVWDGIDWLKSSGADLLPPEDLSPYRVKIIQVGPGQFQGMPALLGKLKARYIKEGGKIAYGAKAKQLIMANTGKVVGVRAMVSRGTVDYMGDAIIVASGGFAANRELLEALVDPDAGHMMVRGTPWATGDGLLMAREAGAALINMAGITTLHVAAVSPEAPSSGNPARAVPFCLGINKNGARYLDESLGYVAHGKAVLRQPGQKVALVFDEVIKKDPAVAGAVENFNRQGIKMVEANTLQELAAKIDAPPDNVVKTVTEFNNAVKDGKALAANPPKAALAYKIATPKFYAFYPLVPGITLTFGGIKVNAKGQALEADGTVIPGLFAAGECAGGLYYGDYIGGASLANCLVMGRVTGKQAAAMKTEIKQAEKPSGD